MNTIISDLYHPCCVVEWAEGDREDNNKPLGNALGGPIKPTYFFKFYQYSKYRHLCRETPQKPLSQLLEATFDLLVIPGYGLSFVRGLVDEKCGVHLQGRTFRGREELTITNRDVPTTKITCGKGNELLGYWQALRQVHYSVRYKREASGRK
jgi:hypothetical protein